MEGETTPQRPPVVDHFEGEITRQRRVIEEYFHRLSFDDIFEGRKGKGRWEPRQRNICDYLEGAFSENRIRQYYALYLWGRSWKADYEDCPASFRAAAENAPYERVILSLVSDWVAFKKAASETETT